MTGQFRYYLGHLKKRENQTLLSALQHRKRHYWGYGARSKLISTYVWQQLPNKAGYTATSCGRVGRGGNARFPIFRLVGYGRRTDRWTDGRTDKASHRVACPQLKSTYKALEKKRFEMSPAYSSSTTSSAAHFDGQKYNYNSEQSSNVWSTKFPSEKKGSVAHLLRLFDLMNGSHVDDGES